MTPKTEKLDLNLILLGSFFKAGLHACLKRPRWSIVLETIGAFWLLYTLYKKKFSHLLNVNSGSLTGDWLGFNY